MQYTGKVHAAFQAALLLFAESLHQKLLFALLAPLKKNYIPQFLSFYFVLCYLVRRQTRSFLNNLSLIFHEITRQQKLSFAFSVLSDLTPGIQTIHTMYFLSLSPRLSG